jgi:hypothetical protein
MKIIFDFGSFKFHHGYFIGKNFGCEIIIFFTFIGHFETFNHLNNGI